MESTNRSISFSWLLFLFLVCTHLFKEAQGREIYLGADSGPSFSSNAFLIVTDPKFSPLRGTIYYFDLRVAADLKFTNPSPLSCRPVMGPAMEYYKSSVINQNKSLLYFKLKLNNDEVENLILNFSNLMEKKTTLAPYNILHSTCTSQIFQLLKSSINESRQRELGLLEDSTNSLLRFITSFYTDHRAGTPSHAAYFLKDSPLADGPLLLFPRFDLKQMTKFQNKVLPIISELSNCGLWQPRTTEVATLTFILGLRSPEGASYLQSLQKLVASTLQCERRELFIKNFWTTVFDLLPINNYELRAKTLQWATDFNKR